MLTYVSQNNIPIISIFFIFAVFPLSLFIYYDFKDKYKNKVLLAISIMFIGIVTLKQLPLLLIMVGANYLLYRKAVTLKESGHLIRNAWLILVATLNLLVWVVGVSVGEVLGFPYILGCGVIPFLAIRTIVTSYKGDKDYSFTEYGLYLLFFPRLFVGPFDSIDDFYKKRNENDSANKQVFDGSLIYLFGALQFAFLGVRLINLATTLNDFSPIDVTILSRWLSVFAFAVGIYHTIGGVANAAIGIAHAYGISMNSGWSPPYNSSSIIGFSRRFNGTLEQLIRNSFSFYSVKAPKVQFLFKLILTTLSGAILGLWLDFSPAFMIWGIVIMLLTMIELMVLKNFLKRIPKVASKVLTVGVLTISFAFLCSAYYNWDSFFLKELFNIGTKLVNDITNYYLVSYIFILLAGVLFATDLPYKILDIARVRVPKILVILKPIMLIIMVIIVTSLII